MQWIRPHADHSTWDTPLNPTLGNEEVELGIESVLKEIEVASSGQAAHCRDCVLRQE